MCFKSSLPFCFLVGCFVRLCNTFVHFGSYYRLSYTIMPLPEDKTVVETGDSLVKTLRGAFGTPESYRPGRFLTASLLPSKLDTRSIKPDTFHSSRKRPSPTRYFHSKIQSLIALQRTSLHRPKHSSPRPLLLLHRPPRKPPKAPNLS